MSGGAGSVRVVSRHTTFQLAADPSVEQERALARHEGAARFAFNQCLRLHLDARHQHTEDEKTVESVKVPWSGFDFINAFNAWKCSQAAGRRFHRIGRITAVDRHQATRKSETIQHVLVSDLGRLAQTHGRGYPRGKRALSWGFYTWRRFMGGFLIPRVPRALAFTDARTSRWALLRRQWFSWNKAWPSDWDPDRR